MRVSVIGGSTIGPETAAVAEALGERLAERGHAVVCGGLGGVMAAVCRGARTADGETIGILPTDDRRDANPHVTTPIATGLGHARNALVVMNGDAAVAVDGAGGTLSEIGLALAQGRPVAGIDTHDVDGVEAVDSPTAAVTYVERAAGAD
ncbi:TIGR00725 family protein [Halorubrum ezzemoulense]|uniref:TIGR00725 family protein n=2 Tax=Halorubrum ezzemoulense TaxID=337243 RepID=A0A256IM74_HALEZ|nr:TIGR00725 family protein [Halorubrum ezzemoulense]MDB2236783.1 TIGR00725 family protein [Halorubrum ezzemoulense]MDB2247228.1 TIGR00725 family protein [Halorubrum ezzemoulense]MDB2269915.1 TIGR00725 family protein [Halorubrum ezzemoulense]OSP10104.1 TIGR00725 family protein [Halorubrum ezzemoulense DSM 17463]OYR57670.1 TIGR00725 family protein [Halorubrum ezzemoulense]